MRTMDTPQQGLAGSESPSWHQADTPVAWVPPGMSRPARESAPVAGLRVHVARLRDWAALHSHVPKIFPEIDADTLGYWLRNERPAMLVAEIDGQFAGFCHLRVRRQGAMLWLNYVGVMPEFRRQGVAQALLREVQVCAAAWGCARVELDALVRNVSAVALYDRCTYRCLATMVDELGRIKYRYRKEVVSGGVERQAPPALPPRWQRAMLRLLYAAWITAPQRASALVRSRFGSTALGES